MPTPRTKHAPESAQASPKGSTENAQSQNSVLMGIDTGVKNTAVVTLAGGKLHRCDIIHPTKGTSENGRYLKIARDVMDIVELMNPELVGVEGFSLQSKGRAVSMLYGVGWAIRFGLMQCKREFADVPPTTWKKFCGAGGGASKEKATKAVQDKWNFVHDVQDAHDAYAIAQLIAKYRTGTLPDTDMHLTIQQSILRNRSPLVQEIAQTS